MFVENKDNPEKAKKTNSGLTVLVMIGVMFLAYKGCSSIFKSEPSQNEPPRVETRQEQIQKGFSAWDGRHKQLTEVIKRAANDPNSYENISTTYVDHDSYLTVSQTYTLKNAFGGRVRGTVVAKCSVDGDVLEIIAQK